MSRRVTAISCQPFTFDWIKMSSTMNASGEWWLGAMYEWWNVSIRDACKGGASRSWLCEVRYVGPSDDGVYMSDDGGTNGRN